MYGFRRKEVAEHLRDFSDDKTRYKPHEGMKKQALRDDHTRVVRVMGSSGNVSGINDCVGGLVNGEDNTEHQTWTNMELYGNYLSDYAICHELWFEQMNSPRQGDNIDQNSPSDHVRSTFKPTQDYVDTWTAGTDWRINGTDGDRAKLVVHNFCPLPLTVGMIITVHRVGRRWVYSGNHTLLADTNISTITTETYGNVTIYHYPGLTDQSFDFDSTGTPLTTSTEVLAYNPWTETVPAGKKCMLGVASGRITIMGWEC